MTKITKTHIIDALMKNYGNMAAAAQALGTTRQNIQQRVKGSKELQKARQQAEEQAIDLAEHSILTQIKEKNTTATIFFLKTKGRSRGWIEPQHVVHSGDIDHTIKTVVVLPPKDEA
jgi:hypothetical protein